MTDPAVAPGWRRLLAAARRSLERTGGRLDGAVSLSTPDDDERRVVIGITGVHRPVAVGRVTVRLTEIDAHLRATYGRSLVDVLGPVRDRPAERGREAVARDAVLALSADSRHAGSPWFEQWLAGLRRDGTMTRIVRGGLPFRSALAVLDALPAAGLPLPVVAERVLDDTKALTDGPVRGLVLRALANWHGLPSPAGAEQERTLWELAGVVPDDLASQVLILNLPASGGRLGDWLTGAAAGHVPFRITLHQLRLAPVTVDRAEVFVCENPAVLRAAAGRPTGPVICTEGVPSVAVHELLASLRPGSAIRWHNDFDWTGVRMTAAAVRRHGGTVPWRMGVADYLGAAGSGVVLTGTPAGTPWDPRLAAAMRETGHAVMEERLLDGLLSDLTAAAS